MVVLRMPSAMRTSHCWRGSSEDLWVQQTTFRHIGSNSKPKSTPNDVLGRLIGEPAVDGSYIAAIQMVEEC